MKKLAIVLAAASLAAAGASAQNALDAIQLSDRQLNGTARFMGMAGAFTALGGDLSTLGQNPGGIGVYTRSEVGATMAININSVDAGGNSVGQTKVTCPNFGYIGSVRTGSSLFPQFAWGATYGRVASFDRTYRGNFGSINGSLTNYVAAYTEGMGVPAADLGAYNSATDYDPFYNTAAPWLSILMYNSYGINPLSTAEDCNQYDGLYDGAPGKSWFDVIQKGYVDEYNINFGGNIANIVSWGFGFGITDIEFTNDTYYEEEFQQARISNASADGFASGSAKLGLQSWRHMWGSGFNFKAGVIVKPVEQLRIGLSIHTPTYYNLNYEAWAQTNFAYGSGLEGVYPDNDQAAPTQNFSWKLRTPMRILLGIAGIIDQRAIVSLDYECRPVTHAKVELSDNYSWGGWGYDYNTSAQGFYDPVNENIKQYYTTQNIIRLGLEYRLSSQFSARAGFSYETSPVKTEVADGQIEVFTDGADQSLTQPSYVLPKDSYDITVGLGWHYKNFYADAAYVYHHRAADFWSYSNYEVKYPDHTTEMVQAARCPLGDSDSRIVISAGFKF